MHGISHLLFTRCVEEAISSLENYTVHQIELFLIMSSVVFFM